MHNAFHAGKSNTRGGWALELKIFVGPLKLHEPLGECHLGPTNIESSRAQPLEYWICLHENHYAQGCKIYRCIGNFMSMSPGRFQGPHMVGGEGG